MVLVETISHTPVSIGTFRISEGAGQQRTKIVVSIIALTIIALNTINKLENAQEEISKS